MNEPIKVALEANIDAIWKTAALEFVLKSVLAELSPPARANVEDRIETSMIVENMRGRPELEQLVKYVDDILKPPVTVRERFGLGPAPTE